MKQELFKQSWPKLIVSVLVCELVGIASTPFVIGVIPTWYATLRKPSFSPPNWIFGPVWIILYALMGVAFYLIWKQNLKKKRVKSAITFFALQLGLNFLWSLLFFGLRSPILGLIDIIALVVFVALTMRKFLPLSKLAFYLLLPYLFWVSFATVLNLSIVLLN